MFLCQICIDGQLVEETVSRQVAVGIYYTSGYLGAAHFIYQAEVPPTHTN